MIMISFRSKRDREHLLEKAKKMEEYASMIVDCIEKSKEDEDDEYYERSYRDERSYREPEDEGRYGYRRRMR